MYTNMSSEFYAQKFREHNENVDERINDTNKKIINETTDKNNLIIQSLIIKIQRVFNEKLKSQYDKISMHKFKKFSNIIITIGSNNFDDIVISDDIIQTHIIQAIELVDHKGFKCDIDCYNLYFTLE